MTKYGNYDCIAFPLGGIGAGNISLKSNGALCDFEIFNRPSRRSINPFSHFAVKAQEKDNKTVWRVLQGDFADGFTGYPSTGDEVWVYGNGKDRTSLAGIKHFEKADFSAFFPIAEIDFESEGFPGNVKLCAFSPFIPMNSDDSSLPCAIFEITFSNTTDEDLLYTAALSVSNPFKGGRYNRVISENGMTGSCTQMMPTMKARNTETSRASRPTENFLFKNIGIAADGLMKQLLSSMIFQSPKN